MTAFRSAQRAYDAQTPPEPAHDYTEDMHPSELSAWLLRWFDVAPDVTQDDIVRFINKHKAREMSEFEP